MGDVFNMEGEDRKTFEDFADPAPEASEERFLAEQAAIKKLGEMETEAAREEAPEA